MLLFFRRSHRRCSIKKLLSKISKFSQETTRVEFFFVVKPQAFRHATWLKKDSNTVVFLRKYWKISENSFFEEHLRTAASGFYLSLQMFTLAVRMSDNFFLSIYYMKYLNQHETFELLCSVFENPYKFPN